MVVKSETSKCTWCENLKKFWRDLKNDEPYAIVTSITSIIVITALGFGYVEYDEVSSKSSKYAQIITDKPILRCGDEMEIKSSNYKVILVDKNPLIKVFYSDTKIETYELSECSIIQEMFNAELGVENVEFVNNELKSTITKLKEKIKDGKKIISIKEDRIKALIATNKKIKKDYKLPTYKQLDKHYTAYTKSKKKAIESYLEKLKKAEKIALAKARAENTNNVVEHIPCAKDDQDCLDLEYDVWQ